MRATLFIVLTCLLMLLQGCSQAPSSPGIQSHALCWHSVPGWQQDQTAQALPALLRQCPRLSKKTAWQHVCQAAMQLSPSDNAAARAFFQTHFTPHPVLDKQGEPNGLFTGYYEPTLYGSYQPSERYYYPLYKQPNDMIIVKLESRFPELKGRRVRGRLDGNVLLPYYSREEIDNPRSPLQGEELLWVDDADAAFFLHIQGSGRIELPDGSMVGVGYANQNGHPYVAIGKLLIEQGELTQEEVSLQSIRHWLQTNPGRAEQLKAQNPSYVFFQTRNDLQNGPRGSLNVPLTQERSVAIDRKIIPLGTPLWISTTLPDGKPYQRLVMAQDTGGAITGPVRADIFFGRGQRAEALAGTMKQSGTVFALLPKTANTPKTRCP